MDGSGPELLEPLLNDDDRRVDWQAHASIHLPAGSKANKESPIWELQATSVPAHRLGESILWCEH